MKQWHELTPEEQQAALDAHVPGQIRPLTAALPMNRQQRRAADRNTRRTTKEASE